MTTIDLNSNTMNNFNRQELVTIMSVVGARITQLLDIVDKDNAAGPADSTLGEMRRQSNVRYLHELNGIYAKLDVAVDALDLDTF